MAGLIQKHSITSFLALWILYARIGQPLDWKTQHTHFVSEGSLALTKKYGLRQAVINDPQHLQYFDQALSTLSDVTGLPKEAMGLGGELTVIPDVIGNYRSPHSADFDSNKKLIRNLDARNSLAHEWVMLLIIISLRNLLILKLLNLISHT